MAEYLVLYNSKRPHKSLELMTPVDYILRESKNCNMWWTHTYHCKIKTQMIIIIICVFWFPAIVYRSVKRGIFLCVFYL
ncbi:hypothetical protein KPHVMX_740001 [Klebsiella pneumoniae]|nr:hypothetical protein KPHVMX_740001 [Klebsiella pneumoniae]